MDRLGSQRTGREGGGTSQDAQTRNASLPVKDIANNIALLNAFHGVLIKLSI